MLKRPGCVSRVRVRAERRLAEAHVDRVVEPLHPDRHLRSAPGARPPVGQPVERLPETPPETDLDGPRDRTFGAYVTRYDGMHGSARIRWNLPLLQRGRYSVAPDKEADVRLRASENTRIRRSQDIGFASLDNNCFCEHRDSRGVKKRKERPPKDSRPKEKRFRHGGRKGRRASRERDRSR